jgi:hypothetical protein
MRESPNSLDADSKIVGSLVHINGDPFTVIGVMPETLSNVDTPVTCNQTSHTITCRNLFSRRPPILVLPGDLNPLQILKGLLSMSSYVRRKA